eukprot:TRINITY_DN7274_c0_g3_i1.p1 TRINITY_DN7274_c0_g3~~TRINITY_DN7274_c0_g3_i1.p1  ORF type:complete len:235 (+),score=30.50 TRINITY_DN7274_c0_g3_i1:84-788(+)
MPSLVGSEMCIRDRWYQRRVHGESNKSNISMQMLIIQPEGYVLENTENISAPRGDNKQSIFRWVAVILSALLFNQALVNEVALVCVSISFKTIDFVGLLTILCLFFFLVAIVLYVQGIVRLDEGHISNGTWFIGIGGLINTVIFILIGGEIIDSVLFEFDYFFPNSTPFQGILLGGASLALVVLASLLKGTLKRRQFTNFRETHCNCHHRRFQYYTCFSDDENALLICLIFMVS